MDAWDDILRARLRTMQIVAGALIGGVVLVLGLVTALALSGQRFGNPGPLPFITVLAFVMFAGGVIAMVLVTRTMQTAGLQSIAGANPQSDLVQLLGLKQAMLILTLSLYEGPALLACTALLLERQAYVVAVPLLALSGMALNFPTENKVRNWLEINARRVLELRESPP